MTDDQDNLNTTEVDQARLAAVGVWRAAVCIGPDGVESYWLLSPDPQGEPGCACPTCVPHEQLGPIPVVASTEESSR